MPSLGSFDGRPMKSCFKNSIKRRADPLLELGPTSGQLARQEESICYSINKTKFSYSQTDTLLASCIHTRTRGWLIPQHFTFIIIFSVGTNRRIGHLEVMQAGRNPNFPKGLEPFKMIHSRSSTELKV